MKKLSFALLFFTAIAWLWIGHMMGADTVYQRVGGNTVISGELGGGGSGLTNENVNSWVIFTNNGVSISMTASGVLIFTNYAAAGLGFSLNTNGIVTAKAGANTAPSIQFGDSTTGIYRRNTDEVNIATVGLERARFSNTGNLVVMNLLTLSSSADVGIRRSAAGVLEVNTGSAGALGATILTSSAIFTNTVTATNSFQLPTNYVAANFTPVAGMVKIASSNGVLYKVTQLSTNLLGPDTP